MFGGIYLPTRQLTYRPAPKPVTIVQKRTYGTNYAYNKNINRPRYDVLSPKNQQILSFVEQYLKQRQREREISTKLMATFGQGTPYKKK